MSSREAGPKAWRDSDMSRGLCLCLCLNGVGGCLRDFSEARGPANALRNRVCRTKKEGERRHLQQSAAIDMAGGPARKGNRKNHVCTCLALAARRVRICAYLALMANVFHTSALARLRCAIFQTSYNPTCVRTGAKYLRKRLRGPSMVRYYPQEINLSQIARQYPELELVNEDEEQRLQDVEDRKKRGKGAPKKADSKSKFLSVALSRD